MCAPGSYPGRHHIQPDFRCSQSVGGARSVASVGVFMRAIFDGSGFGTTAKDPHFCGSPPKLSGRKFGAVAKVLWPVDTAKTIGRIANRSHRTAERWLSGEFEPPAIVIAAAIHEMTREL